jgi:hypothetical protein
MRLDPMPQHTLALSPSAVALKVHWIRHEKVILDFDLAALFGVEARALNQAAKRNPARFPDDFMFQLTHDDLSRARAERGCRLENVVARSHLHFERKAKIVFT